MHNQGPAAAKSLQSCPNLCDPIDGSPPGSAVPGILQARTLEWAAISFSNAWKWKVKVKSLSHVQLLATPWTGAYQAPPPMGFSRQEYWSGGATAFSNQGPKSTYIIFTGSLFNLRHLGHEEANSLTSPSLEHAWTCFGMPSALWLCYLGIYW